MPGWVVKVRYSDAMKPGYPADFRAFRRVIHWPYQMDAGQPVVVDWATVWDEIQAAGVSRVWCRLAVPPNPDLNIPGAIWYTGAIPDVPEYIEPPVSIDSAYKANLQTAAAALKALLDLPEWDAYARRFAQLTSEELEARPAYRLASQIQERLGELTRG